MKGIIYFAKNNFDVAERVFKEGILIDYSYSDLYYNLGYLYEIRGEYQKALKYYRRALEFTENYKDRDEIKQKIDLLNTSAESQNEIRIAFFIKKGLDNFIDDLDG